MQTLIRRFWFSPFFLMEENWKAYSETWKVNGLGMFCLSGSHFDGIGEKPCVQKVIDKLWINYSLDRII